MKSTGSAALATWMLKHLTFGGSEALVGDLLEEFLGGRSLRWYWRQVLCAIGIGVCGKSRDYAFPLLFSAAWSMLYPAWWLSIVRIWSSQTLFERWTTIDWPYSTALHGIGQIIPAAAFVWLGFFVFLTLRTGMAHELSRLRLFGSLSISLNVLLITTIGLWMHLRSSGMNVSYVARENFYSGSHLIAIGIPLTLSLLSAISFALSGTRRRRHGTASVAG
jgi:hypothetical protein